MNMTIRPAAEADRDAILAVHIASWRASYQGTLPDEFLRNGLPGALRGLWAERTLPGEDLTLVAEADGIRGFVIVILTGDEPYCYNLHTDPTARGRGIGTRLLHAAAGRLLALGHRSMHLDVFEENTRTRAFYRRLGGVEGPAYDEELFGQPVRTVPVRWADLGRLFSTTMPAG